MIQFNNVAFGYKRKKPVYNNLQVQLQNGSIYGLLGKNGAGKSTLLKLITGLVFPVSGKINVMGFDPTKRYPAFLEKIFFIPEEIDTPAVHVMAFARSFAPFYPNFRMEQFDTLLHEFEIPLTSLHNMSFGQKKKTWIALGIAANTELLIMDEPTNGLDIPSKTQLRKMLAGSINEDRCIIISTHQVRDLDNLIDKIMIVEDGEMLLNTAVETITEKLFFRQLQDDEIDSTVIYSEKHFFGHAALLLNSAKAHSKIDMELFFNAAINNKKQLQQVFQNA